MKKTSLKKSASKKIVTRGAATRPGSKSVAGLVVQPMKKIRAGMIGFAGRGWGHFKNLLMLEGAEVTAVCEMKADALEKATKLAVEKGRPKPALYGPDRNDYLRMLERDDIDIVVIATDWNTHAPMAVQAMRAGKHVFLEVPAAVTTDQCWELVESAEKTGLNCMMLENVCYGREELMVLNMVRQGLLGTLLHGEAAYIHDLRSQMNDGGNTIGTWRTLHYAERNGNLYPTHGLGPIAQYMNINRGDRFERMVSMSSPAEGRKLYAAKNFPADHKWNKIKKWRCGDMNSSLIRTALGRTVLVQWDETSPRPYTRLNLIQGTKGCWAGYPDRLVVEGRTPSTHEWVQGDALKPWYDEFDHPLWKRMGDEAVKAGGHGGMDFLMMWRLVYCLRNGEPLDQDVYDAAAWSVIRPLSEESIRKGNAPVEIPDFTRGRWKKTPPLGIVR
ncbi:MAG: Gfo/Idh/MocA family oxidoreductase [Kiritimatiellae bacterium]|nr:Gfo/Idh/MocA family oxidoreductase [Kiritimatiellia bacterium]